MVDIYVVYITSKTEYGYKDMGGRGRYILISHSHKSGLLHRTEINQNII